MTPAAHAAVPGVPPARRAALEALSACLDKGLEAQAALDLTLRRLLPGDDAGPRGDGHAAQDRGLATELLYGYLRLAGRLDFLLNHFLKDPAGLPESVRRILGLAAYELLFLERVPAYASVGWAVEAVRQAAGPGLAKMANAVLRNVDRLGADAHAEAFYRQEIRGRRVDETEFLSRFYACPRWIVELWQRAHGPQGCLTLLRAQVAAPALGLRCNRVKAEALELRDYLAGLPGCIVKREATVAFAAAQPPDINLPGVLARGLLSRQSAAAQLALLGLEPDRWPTPVWDACAGRGGKTLALLERGCGPLWASDVNLPRLRQIRQEARRLGLPLPPVFLASAERPPFSRRLGDPGPATVLLDAPCSGLGVLSRRPDTKWKRRPEDLSVFAGLQRDMLQRAARDLPSGGMLAYVTCTVNPAENEAQVEQLARASGLRVRTMLPVEPQGPQGDRGLRLGEFFFAASLVRR